MRLKLSLNNLSIKLSLVFSIIMSISSTVLIVNSFLEEKDLLMKESTARFQSIAGHAAFSAEYGVLTKNLHALNQIATGVMQEKDVNYMEILDKGGDVLAQLGRSKAPSYQALHPIYTQRVDASDADTDYLFGQIVTESANDLGSASGEGAPSESAEAKNSSNIEQIGQVKVEFDLAPMEMKLNYIRNRAVLFSLFSVILGILLTYLVVRLMISPLKDLVLATRKVASGDLDFQVKSKSQDEIGELASSFNIMTLNLKGSTISRDYLDTVLESIPDSIIVAKSDGTIDTVNQGTVALSGFSQEDLAAKPVGQIMSVEENVFLTKDGDAIPVSISAGIIRGESGQIKGTVYVVHDMRPTKKLQERLVQSEKMAAVGQLAAGVSHEINNPLGVILGFAQGLVRRLKENDPLELPLKSIEREATRCKDLVQDLLTFSRATHAEKEPMDLNQAVEGALSLVQAQARMDRAEVQKMLGANLPRILGNKNQIQQVIINLANNAIDAMPKGGTVTVKTELQEEKFRSWVCLRVTDTGVGIPAEVLPRIFEPFFTTKPVGKGTGLGLSLVYEIAKKHSGTVEVQSRPGQTEFCIKLPVRTGRENDDQGYPSHEMRSKGSHQKEKDDERTDA